MGSFKDDEKWIEAKKAVDSKNSWLEVISYYRSIDGKNVFVYSVIEGDKRLIVDVLDDERILLINKQGEPIIDSYVSVLNSRKIFKYNEDSFIHDFFMGSNKYKIAVESHK